MTDSIGNVDFIVGIDGSVVPAEAAALGALAGRIAGEAYEKSFNAAVGRLGITMRRQFAQLGIQSGSDFATGIRRALPSIQSIGGAVQRSLGAGVKDAIADWGHLEAIVNSAGSTARSAGNDFIRLRGQITTGAGASGLLERAAASLGERFRSLRSTVTGIGNDFRNFRVDSEGLSATFTRLRGGLGGVVARLRQLNDESGNFFKQWKELPHGLRQALLYTGLFASLGSQISILGSAAASSLAVLGIAATALGAGLGVLIAGFIGMKGELDTIAPGAQDAAVALKALLSGLTDIRMAIQGKLFEGLAGPIQNLTDNLLPVLKDGLVGIAGTLNTFLAQLSSSLTSPAALTALQTLLAGFQPILASLLDGFLQLGGALAKIAVVGLPFAQDFAAGLDKMLTTFNQFLASTDGQTALLTFFEHGKEVIGAILPFLAAVAQGLASLITPETIKLFTDAFGQLTQFTPVLAGLLLVVAKLDVFGLAAKLLNEVGKAVAPLLPQLETLATLLSDSVSQALTTLGPIFGDLLAALLPFVSQIVELASSLLSVLLPAIAPVVGALIAALPAFLPLVKIVGDLALQIGGFLVKVLTDLAPYLTQLIELAVSLAEPLGTLVSTALPPLIDLLLLVFDAVKPLIPSILDLAQLALKPFIDGLIIIAPLLSDLLRLLLPLLKPTIELTGLVLDLVSAFLDWVTGTKSASQAFGDFYHQLIGFIGPLIDQVEGLINVFTRLFGITVNLPSIGNTVSKTQSALGLTSLRGGFASGGIISKDGLYRAGEGGKREAIVPLEGPLSNVNPAVRALAEFARGTFSGSSSSSNTTMTTEGPRIEAGAITIVAGEAPAGEVADNVLDEIVNNLH